jgi:2-polyprenyl-3-methyl-5-hydroxy-6-metoxy-1,4-benzoquinol methylase
MNSSTSSADKILVAIASYGHGNDRFLAQLIREYRSMPFEIDIVVLSNIAKDCGPDVKVVVGLPSKDPWSLPFAHKEIFAAKLNNYDLFIYSEDDILITETNIRAFLKMSAVLPDDRVAGFLRIEKGSDGQTYFPEVHHRFHWIPDSVMSRDDYVFASFSNEHAACYLLTRGQLRQAISSGGFLVGPHQDKYDLLCTAATDPYTQCGFRKVVCISHLDDCTVHHLPNKYLDRMGTSAVEVNKQVKALLMNSDGHKTEATLLGPGAGCMRLPFATYYAKSYYEPAQTAVASLLPTRARSVLSLGCGWGATEEWLAKRGLRVVAVPLDGVISACAQSRGIELVYGDLGAAREALAGQQFDCLLISNLLHLVEDPVELLASFGDLLSKEACAIAIVPNSSRLTVLWRKLRSGRSLRDFLAYERAGVHLTSHNVVRKWFKKAGMQVENMVDVLPSTAQRIAKATLGFTDRFLASELIVVARIR